VEVENVEVEEVESVETVDGAKWLAIATVKLKPRPCRAPLTSAEYFRGHLMESRVQEIGGVAERDKR
jgi:hypothetical protein